MGRSPDDTSLRRAELLAATRQAALAARPKIRQAKLNELQRLCDRVSAHAKKRGLTEEKLRQLLAAED